MSEVGMVYIENDTEIEDLIDPIEDGYTLESAIRSHNSIVDESEVDEFDRDMELLTDLMIDKKVDLFPSREEECDFDDAT